MVGKIREYASSNPLATVLIFSGLAGFSLGLSNATWQVTVESGQVLAGIVRYPPDNPFYIYHIKLFAIINQISVLLLRLIGSEKVISIFVSGLLGMISFMAIATLIFAVNRSITISILGVILIYFANYVGNGAIYPIWFLGQPHTYGILGLSFTVLTIALLGAKAYRAGLFCLGLAPCVHPSLGAWLVFVVCLSAALQWNYARQIIKEHYGYLIAGLLVTLAGLAYQVHLIADLPTPVTEENRMYFDAYIKYWGSHQQKLYWGYTVTSISFKRWGVFFCAYSVIAGCLARRLFKKDEPVAFMFTVIMVSGIGALLLGLLTQLPPESMPPYLLMFMPGRCLNLNNVVLAASLLGLLTCSHNRAYVTNYNIFVILLICSFYSRHCQLQMVVFGVILWWLGYVTFASTPKAILLGTRRHRVSYEMLLAAFLAALLLINSPKEKFVHRFLVHPGDFKNRTNNEFYAGIGEREGLLLTTHYSSLVPLKTRRPILVDMASPNTITYAPESGPAFNNILKRIYGVDLLVPPAPEYRHSEIPPELYKGLWEQRTPAEWREIGREFGVTDILTRADWRLSLPVAAEGEGMVLYEIPVE
jgi:hypothetical protein